MHWSTSNSFNRGEDLRHGGYQSTVIDSTRLVSSTSRDHAAMQKLQLKSSHPTLIVDLNKDNFDRCSQSSEICLEKFNYDPALVDHILWSDECKFNRNRTVNRHNCTYCSTENPHAKFTVRNTEDGIMVWYDLSSDGLFGRYFFNETVTGLTYRQMFVDYTWPQLQRKKLYFQHGRAALYYAVIVGEWLDEKFPGRWIGRHGSFDWPARSPDLTQYDFFLWSYLKDIVFKEPCTSIMQLQNRIQEACAGITKAMYVILWLNDHVTV